MHDSTLSKPSLMLGLLSNFCTWIGMKYAQCPRLPLPLQSVVKLLLFTATLSLTVFHILLSNSTAILSPNDVLPIIFPHIGGLRRQMPSLTALVSQLGTVFTYTRLPRCSKLYSVLCIVMHFNNDKNGSSTALLPYLTAQWSYDLLSLAFLQ